MAETAKRSSGAPTGPEKITDPVLLEKMDLLYKAVDLVSSRNGWLATGVLSKYLLLIATVQGIDANTRRNKSVQVYTGRKAEMLKQLGYNTAFTTGLQVVFMDDFLKTLTKQGIMFVLCHELAHIAFRHNARQQGRDARLWNIACDTVINTLLNNFTLKFLYKQTADYTGKELYERPEDVVGIGFSPATAHYFKKYENYSEEEVYYELSNDHHQRLNQPTPPNPPSQGGGGKGQGGGKGKSKSSPGQGQQQPGGGGGSGDPDPSGTPTDDHAVDEGQLRKELEDAFGDEGADLANEMGLGSSDPEKQQDRKATLDRMLNEAGKLSQAEATASNSREKSAPGMHIDSAYNRGVEAADVSSRYSFHIYCDAILEEAIKGRWDHSSTLESEESIMSRDKGYRRMTGLTRQVFIPELVRKSQKARALYIIDTSGSVSEQELALFTGYIRNQMEMYDMRVRIISADTVVRGCLEYESVEDLPSVIPLSGGGGTDMLTPMADELSKDVPSSERHQMVCLLSDGEFHMFTREELYEKMQEFNPYVTDDNIVPIAALITNQHYCDHAANVAAESFGGTGFRAFFVEPGLHAAMHAGKAPEEYTVTKDDGIQPC